MHIYRRKFLFTGRLCRRNDLVYVFRFSDGKEVTTASPAVTREFSQSGSWHVNVTATNLGKPIRLLFLIVMTFFRPIRFSGFYSDDDHS